MDRTAEFFYNQYSKVGLVDSLLGVGISFFHHKLQIPFIVHSRKWDLIWYETTWPGLDRHRCPETALGLSVQFFGHGFALFLLTWKTEVKSKCPLARLRPNFERVVF